MHGKYKRVSGYEIVVLSLSLHSVSDFDAKIVRMQQASSAKYETIFVWRVLRELEEMALH
jgi:hypothetical protein